MAHRRPSGRRANIGRSPELSERSELAFRCSLKTRKPVRLSLCQRTRVRASSFFCFSCLNLEWKKSMEINILKAQKFPIGTGSKT